jgi:hypothetical protein
MVITGKKISELGSTDIAAFKSLLSIIPKLNDFSGLNVVWLGTSVPDYPAFGEVSTKKYPEFVADMLGFTLSEQCIGGSHLTFDHANSRYGLSMTAAEQITYNAERGVDVSYENLLTDDWKSDVFVFDHCHNDEGYLDALVNNEDYWDTTRGTFKITVTNVFDRTWAVGAFNYVIAEIYRAKPRAKIVIINSWIPELTSTILAQRVVAEYWNIPICELRLGNANVAIVSTANVTLPRYSGTGNITLLSGGSANPRSFYTTEAPDEGEDTDAEQTHATGSDTIHPGRYGRIMFAKHVASFLFNNVFMDNDTDDYYFLP